MRKNSKKLVLPAIAAAGAVMGAVKMASADFVITMTLAQTNASFDEYVLSVVNNTSNSSGTLLLGAGVTITMNAGQPGEYILVDEHQDLGNGNSGAGAFDGVHDANLTGNIDAGNSNPNIGTTVHTDTFGSATIRGTFLRVSGASGVTTDSENGVKDNDLKQGVTPTPYRLWSSDVNGGVVSSVFSSLTSLEIVQAGVSGGAPDTSPQAFINIVVPHGAKFTASGYAGAPSGPGSTSIGFQTNFTTSNASAGGTNPIVLLSSSPLASTNVGSQLGGTYSPIAGPTLTVQRTAPTQYIPGYIHGLTGTTSGFTQIAGFSGTDPEKFLLKLSGTYTGAGTEDAQLVADINASGNGTVTATVASADSSLATLGGTTWDIELTSTAGFENGYFGFNFSGDTNANGITVTDVAAVPEPATAGLLLVGGLGLLARRRRSAQLA
jgi:hypothetical protein